MDSNQATAELAYRLWVERGRPHDSADADWLEAERQLALSLDPEAADSKKEGEIDESLEETFPASDPPASHSPDLPPANASDKWAAASSRSRNAVAASTKKHSSSPGGGRSAPVDETDDSVATAPGDIGEG